MAKHESLDEIWTELSQRHVIQEGTASLESSLSFMFCQDEYYILDVDLTKVETFKDIVAAFVAAMSVPSWVGANADALFDILNDLPDGRYIFRLAYTKQLRKPLRTTLMSVVGVKRSQGTGYGTGEAIFVFY